MELLEKALAMGPGYAADPDVNAAEVELAVAFMDGRLYAGQICAVTGAKGNMSHWVYKKLREGVACGLVTISFNENGHQKQKGTK